jgi:hypothetical protein
MRHPPTNGIIERDAADRRSCSLGLRVRRAQPEWIHLDDRYPDRSGRAGLDTRIVGTGRL